MATKLMNQFQVSGYVAKVSLCYPPHKGTYVVIQIMLASCLLLLFFQSRRHFMPT